MVISIARQLGKILGRKVLVAHGSKGHRMFVDLLYPKFFLMFERPVEDWKDITAFMSAAY